MESPSWLTELDHTGDAAFEIRAGTLPELFERAALALFGYVSDLSVVRSVTADSFTLTAQDLPALLVGWLSELNYRHTTAGRLYSTFHVTFPADLQLEAEAYGEPIDPERHTLYTEIKAITYHGLSVRNTTEGWIATVILDL
jgi:SHS2 domain-containing protein